jgi:histidine triad (HIT) family protein
VSKGECLFCRIVARKSPATFILENEHVVAFRDVNPQAPAHVLVVPRRHIERLSDLDDADAHVAGQCTLAANAVARDLNLVESGYRVVVNCGAGAGQSVWHLHYHVLGGRPMTWPPG